MQLAALTEWSVLLFGVQFKGYAEEVTEDTETGFAVLQKVPGDAV